MAWPKDFPAPPDFNRALVCHPLSLSYDFKTRQGSLKLPDGECCDMGGCIDLFMAIDPGVTGIETWSGTVRDTFYVLDRDGQWVALVPTEAAS